MGENVLESLWIWFREEASVKREGGREANSQTRVEELAVTEDAGCSNSSGTLTHHCLPSSYLESALDLHVSHLEWGL